MESDLIVIAIEKKMTGEQAAHTWERASSAEEAKATADEFRYDWPGDRVVIKEAWLATGRDAPTDEEISLAVFGA